MSEILYKAAEYIRLSHADDKDGESDSVANQRKILDSFIESQPDIELAAEFVDDGVSGIIFDRPAFKQMMEEIEAGKINCVIVKDLSRFGREFTETGRYLQNILPAYGVRFIALLDNIDTLKDSGDDLLVSLKSLMNDSYCRDISVKTRSALNAKREKGDFIANFTVYGYKKSEDNHNQLVIDPYPAGIVQDIFRMRTEGMSAAKIAQTLNSLGVLSPLMYKKDRGLSCSTGSYCDNVDSKWSATTIIRILRDETYTGTLIQGRFGTANYKIKTYSERPESEWKRVESAHDHIIHKLDFDLVQRIMRLDTRTGPKSGSPRNEVSWGESGDSLSGGEKVYPFSGVLICGCCGARMARKTNTVNGKSYYYYYCRTGKKNGCASPSMLKEGDLAESVYGCIKAHVASIVSIEAILEGSDRQKALAIIAGRVDMQIAENERQVEEIRTFKSSLYENMVKGRITPKEYKEMKFGYVLDEKRLLGAIDLLKQEREDVLAGKSERLRWMGHFKKYEDYTELDRRMVISFIQSIRVISKTQLHITFNYQDEYEKAVALLRREAA